jgi:hypothetical protein
MAGIFVVGLKSFLVLRFQSEGGIDSISQPFLATGFGDWEQSVAGQDDVEGTTSSY